MERLATEILHHRDPPPDQPLTCRCPGRLGALGRAHGQAERRGGRV
jgi:hypothetical protein